MNKFFNGRKYFLRKDNRYYRTTDVGKPLSYDVWNFFHPNDLILKGDVIHHINGDSSDDRIENLQKMIKCEHSKLHSTGKQYTLGKHWFLTDETKQKMSEVKLGNKNQNWEKRRDGIKR